MKSLSVPREVYLAAHAFRSIYDCKLYGLLDGGPAINVDRCDEIIAESARLRISFTKDEVTAAAVDLVSQINMEAHDNSKKGRGAGAGRPDSA